MKRVFCYLLLLALPFMMVLVTTQLSTAKGPYWVALNYDPDYTYLLNSLNLSRMKGVGHVDHPGTTLQVAGAVVLRAVHLLRPSSDNDLQADVLKNPEFYLSNINKAILALNTLMLIILGMATLRLTEDMALSILIQFMPFIPGINATFLYGLTAVRPESFLLLASMLFTFLIILYANKDTEKIRQGLLTSGYIRKISPDTFFAICFSVVSGFAMATKVTFLPLLVIPLITLPAFRDKLRYILGTIFSFIFFTLPIITEYGKVFDWLFVIFTHFGAHGQGTEKIIEPGLYLSNAIRLLRLEVLFSFILLCALSVLLISYAVPRFRKISRGNTHFRLLLGVSLSQLLGVMMVAKHFRGWELYYLLPVSSLSGLILVLLICWLRHLVSDSVVESNEPSHGATKWRVIVTSSGKWIFGIILILSIVFARTKEIVGHSAISTKATAQRMAVYHEAQNKYKEYAKIYYLGSSSPAYALNLGKDTAKKYNNALLRKLYPDAYFYILWNGKYYTWDEEIPLKKILSQYGDRVIFQGPLFEEIISEISDIPGQSKMRKPSVSLRNVFSGSEGEFQGEAHETIYEINQRPE